MQRRRDIMCACQWLCFAVLLVVSVHFGNGVKINRLLVPEVIQHGSSVVLDCDYSLEDSVDVEGLVVKWFFNDRPNPVYQWIPGSKTKRPQDHGILKGKLNLDYKASNDKNTMHRALHILELSAELSGDYTCVVSTFRNEDKQTKKMLVFVPEKDLRLYQVRQPEGKLKVMCTAEGIFPKPDMTIRMTQSELLVEEKVRKESDGLFDVTASAVISDVAPEAPTEFACELRVPEANYTKRKESVYYPGNDNSAAFETEPWLSLIAPVLTWTAMVILA